VPKPSPTKYIIKRTWTAKDACHNAVSGVQTITVLSDRAPTIAQTNPDELCLWPPNKHFMCFSNVATSNSFITATSQDPDAVITRTLTSCVSNEQTSSGACVLHSNALCIRSERNNGKNTRVYTVSFTVSDDRGNTVPYTQQVVVPGNQSGHPNCYWPNTKKWNTRRLLSETSAEQDFIDFTEIDDVAVDEMEEMPIDDDDFDFEAAEEQPTQRGSFWRLW